MRVIRDFNRLALRQPAFVALVVLTLGVGIGTTTAAVNVASSVLFSPLPLSDESRLVLITKALPTGSTPVPFTPAELAAWSEGTRTLASVGGVQYDGAWPWSAEIGSLPATLIGTTVSGNFFAVLGAEPAAGRLLADEDTWAGAEPVAVIGHGLWQRQFGRDPTAMGRRIRLNGKDAIIVGVAPAGFSYPKGAEVWQPLPDSPDAREEGWFNLVARLRPEATVMLAAEEAAILLDRLQAEARAGAPRGLRATVVPLKEAIVGDARPVLALFAGAAILVLVVGCLNVGNMLLVRATTRRREIAVRAALGASPSRLAGDLAAETAVLGGAGGVLGVFIAFWLQRAIVSASPADLPRLDHLRFGIEIAGLAALLAIAATLLAGIAPVVWAARRSPYTDLRVNPGCGSVARGLDLTRRALVGAQFAVALTVTVVAALLARSVLELHSVPLGFAAERLAVVQVPLVGPQYQDPQRRLQFFEELVAGVEALPEVASATPVLLRPFTGTDGWDATFTAEGQPPHDAAANPGLHLEAVLPGYFSTLRVSIVQGRPFTDADRQGTMPVAIVSTALARHAWPGSSAVGQRLKFGGADSPAPWMTVVGLADDVRYRDVASPPPAIYVPLRQSPFPPRFVVLRAAVEGAGILALTQQVVREMDASEPVIEAASVQELLAAKLSRPRFQAGAVGLFSGIAVLLAGLGVFGVLSSFVTQRTRELGLRMALGADLAALRRFVLSQLGWPAAVGLAAGTWAALLAAPIVAPLLFQVSTLDVRAFAAAWAMLAAATVCAAIVPLRRAMRVDPALLLRSET